MKDVIIVGAGPVGLFSALLLAQHGLSVDVYERWPSYYPLPRACGVDHEIIRQLQGAGLMEDLAPLLDPVIGPDKTYEFLDAKLETILKIDWNRPGASGWAQVNQFYQPDFERLLLRRLQEAPGVTLHHGRELVSLEQDGEGVHLGFIENGNTDARHGAQARYVIGADGARSTVRDLLGIRLIDLGFAYDWLVVDVVPHEKRVWKPYVIQHCDPARPTTLVGSGPGRRRWEFMRLPGETIDQLNTTQAAWDLLAPWSLTPDNATLERHAVYTFRGSWADQWRCGRVLLAGDAAHLMPPFLGQGLCAGMRDAMALGWRLAAVFSGGSSDQLLESYGPERREHVVEIIRQAVDMGRLICMIDPDEVAARNLRMKAALADPAFALQPPPEPRLGYAGGYRIDDAHSGTLSVQGRVCYQGHEGLFDDVVGKGWQLLVQGRYVPDAAARAIMARTGMVLAQFGPHGDTADSDGIYDNWFDRLGADAVLVRPDFYIFGSSAIGDIDALVHAVGAMLAVGIQEDAQC